MKEKKISAQEMYGIKERKVPFYITSGVVRVNSVKVV